jgi:hypothetical protein
MSLVQQSDPVHKVTSQVHPAVFPYFPYLLIVFVPTIHASPIFQHSSIFIPLNMFNPSIWLGESFSHFTNPSPLPRSHEYMSDAYTAPPSYPPSRKPNKYHPHRHASRFTPSSSETDLDETDSDIFPTRNQHRQLDFEHFPQISVRLPSKIARDLHTSEILILPSTLTRLKILLYATNNTYLRTLRAVVAGDMRLRDVIKQILPSEYWGDMKSYVKTSGEWVEPGSPTKVSDVAELGRFVVNERGQVEVRIVVGGGRERERERDGAHGHKREMEMGRVEVGRMRVY